MGKKLGILMDDIAHITPKKDTSLALLLAAAARDWDILYFTQDQLFLDNTIVKANAMPLTVHNDLQNWYTLGEMQTIELSALDVVLMRKDPPFDMEFIYTTYLLELAMMQGVFVVNHPKSLRDFNEKCSTAFFPDCCPVSVVSRSIPILESFYQREQDIILKPLSGMGGRGVYHLQQGDRNANVIMQSLTQDGQQTVMAQKYIPEITAGDKRIILIDGKPVPYALARIPKAGDFRGNLAQGAKGVVVELSKRDKEIAERVGPYLADHGLLLVGLDVIGDYLSEINVTSPTGIREIEAATSLDIAGDVISAITQRLGDHKARGSQSNKSQS